MQISLSTQEYKYIILATLMGAGVSACSGGTSTPTAITPPQESNVVGATTQALCEQAAQQDSPDCYVIDGSVASMYGVIGDNSMATFSTLSQNHPNVTEILMVDVPGSENDEVNVQVGRAVREAGLNTRVEANSSVASGGVDYFLAGTQRVVVDGAEIGVHSWAGNNVEGSALPRDDPQHNLYLDYYRDIEFPNFTEFYFYTLNAASSNSIHFMTSEEIVEWQIATPVTQAVTQSDGTTVKVGIRNRIAPHYVNIDQTGTIYIEGDAANTLFTQRSGVSHIDGSSGIDTLALDGKESEYTVTQHGDVITIVDSYYERNGIAVLTNIENIEYRSYEGKTGLSEVIDSRN